MNKMPMTSLEPQILLAAPSYSPLGWGLSILALLLARLFKTNLIDRFDASGKKSMALGPWSASQDSINTSRIRKLALTVAAIIYGM